ncbi:MAG: hypothetical protein ACOYOK_08420 [Pseudobdellovibrionaceae bacterium]
MKIILVYFLFMLTACSSTKKRIEVGAFDADGRCPSFQPRYPSCDIKFGSKGLSVLNSVYETFVGEGAFEIREFNIKKSGDKEFEIVGLSNRGPLTSKINADGLVRLGQDREDEELRNAHVASYCHAGRIFENQTVQVGDEVEI